MAYDKGFDNEDDAVDPETDAKYTDLRNYYEHTLANKNETIEKQYEDN